MSRKLLKSSKGSENPSAITFPLETKTGASGCKLVLINEIMVLHPGRILNCAFMVLLGLFPNWCFNTSTSLRDRYNWFKARGLIFSVAILAMTRSTSITLANKRCVSWSASFWSKNPCTTLCLASICVLSFNGNASQRRIKRPPIGVCVWSKIEIKGIPSGCVAWKSSRFLWVKRSSQTKPSWETGEILVMCCSFLCWASYK